MQNFTKTAAKLFKVGFQMYNRSSPLLTMSLTMRITIYMRLLQTFAKRMGTTKVRKFAAFKAKKFYVSFRPVQKLQQHARRRKLDDQSMRQAYERLQSLLYQSTVHKLNMDALLPKQQLEEVSHEGIMAVLAPAEVTVVSYSVLDGLQERVFKVFCGYHVDSDRFLHAVQSKHQPAIDLFNEVQSSQLAESVEYVGYGSCEESNYYESDEGSALVYMAPEETKKFVDNLQMDKTEFLAESRVVGQDEDQESVYMSEVESREERDEYAEQEAQGAELTYYESYDDEQGGSSR